MNSRLIHNTCNRKGILNFDPRTKIFLLIAGNVAVFLSPGITVEIMFVIGFTLFGFLCGTFKFPLKMLGVYMAMVLLQFLGANYFKGSFGVMIVALSSFICMMLPCALLAGIIVLTTKINEFMGALNKLHVSRKIILPLAVMLRYFPVVSEDWKMIKDAMKMRDISPSFIGFFKKPSLSVECIYVPLLMSASRAADELSAAAITRAIENPEKRTCMVKMKFGFADILLFLAVTAILVWELII